ncbi:tyrosine-type recombinase/integrase [Gordonia rhizosphera]|uniref:Putative tyrosine recombinase n=1 Tax=Gordonia rhizosphera NBRC 16068 TaxID=1108045 RepID=K6X4N2_9ACTN|nr:tyrosine-type recombinase/integrase [Gordonia rhizosphera]GAB93754.1 putative tyrosine recombinase [Gordonia rhizosphera NBRC 16068]
MDDHDIALKVLTANIIDAFGAEYGPGVAGHTLVSERLPTVRRFLRDAGYLAGRPGKRARRPAGKPADQVSEAASHELEEWARWQREVRGIGLGCITHRRAWVNRLVDSLCGAGEIDWKACDVNMLNAFITHRSVDLSPASRALIVDATRSLMRWALATGRVDHDLSGGILRARYTRATLPRGLSPAQVQELLGACDPAAVIGIRDRAVITMLWRLGVRCGETAGLGLDDIDWASGRLTVIGKQQRRLTLPIPVDVGQTLVAWLRVRPTGADDRALFVRLRTPIRALTAAGISGIVAHRADQAGLGVVHAHRLRHTAAMNVIAAGGTPIEARELLGHHTASSTRVYARTDLTSLRALTVPFGQVP